MMELLHENVDTLFLVAWVIVMMFVLRWAFAVNARYGGGEQP